MTANFSTRTYRLVHSIVHHFVTHPLRGEVRERVVRWKHTLENGLIPQGRAVLHRADGSMCCLGVACHLINPDGWVPSRKDSTFLFNEREDLPEATTLALYGMDERVARLFAELNDDEGFSFEEIAEVLQLALDH